MSELLRVTDLHVRLPSPRGTVHAVRGVSLSVRDGEIHGIVGESGCGKTVTAMTILRLHGSASRISGSILFEGGRELLELPEDELRRIRGREISMVFQDPSASLTPLVPIGRQIAEVLRHHLGMDRVQTRRRTCELLESVGIRPAGERIDRYPFELSGGMIQRVMIAMAMACGPRLLIADEPTTALDVTIQAQILSLFRELRASNGLSMLFISHNLAVVAELCDRVSVMYAGRVVEQGAVRDVVRRPAHPYTKALIACIPAGGKRRLAAIPGAPPNLSAALSGCAFAPRCPLAAPRCLCETPRLVGSPDGRRVACHAVKNVRGGGDREQGTADGDERREALSRA